MSVFARRLRGRTRAMVAPLVVVAILGIGAYGCGSGAETTADQSAPGAPVSSADSAGTREAGSSERSGAEDGSRSEDGNRSHPGERAASTRGSGGAKNVEGGGSEAGGPVPSGYRAAVKKAKDSCPPGIGPAQCKAIVEKYLDAPAGPSHQVAQPENCLDFMSQADCEAMLTEQKASSEAGSSIDVEKCLREPTPECEAALRSSFEAQREADK